MIRMILVGDRPAIRKGLRMRLAAEADIAVVGEAADTRAAIDLASALSPDVVLVDVDMPGMDGIELAGQLHRCCPQVSVIVLSIHDDAHTCERVGEAGAAAFVVKSQPAEALLAAIRQAARKERFSGRIPGEEVKDQNLNVQRQEIFSNLSE